jgi:AAA ATPase domain
MEAAKQRALEVVADDLCFEVPEARALLGKLRSSGSTISRVEPDDARSSSGKHTWFLFVQPPTALRERFDLAPEVLLVLAPWPTTQARGITAAERILARDHRLDRGVVLHISKDPRAQHELHQAIGQTGRIYVPMTFDDVLGAADPEAWFRRVLGEHIAQSKLFASGRPVFGWDFVGREQELRALRGRLLDGRPVGLFGLRKVGKTSLLLCLRDQWMRDAKGDEAVVHAVPIHIDLLAVSFAETNQDGILRLVLASMRQVIDELGIELRKVDERGSDEHPRLHGQALRERVANVLQGLLDWSRQQPSRPPVLLLIDEYERLLGAASMPIDDGLDFLDFLRGLVQQHPRTFNFLVAGLRREPAAKSRYGSRQNPLFGFLVEDYLAGLDRTDMRELVRKVGRRLGLRFDHRAVEVLWTETGGHPYLVREYGGIIDAAVPVNERQVTAKTVDASLVTAFREQFHRVVDNTMQEISEAIRELDPQALDALARSGTEGLAVQTAEILCRYGILAPVSGGHRFRIAAFRTWLAHNHVAFSRVAGG